MFSLLAAFLLYSKATPFSRWLEFIEAKTYDFQVSKIYQPLSKHPDVIIVGLDDASLKTEGRLPWSREKMASLIDRLKELEAKVIALDFLFPTEEPNIAIKVFEKLQRKGEDTKDFEYDAIFANSLSQVDSILGMVLTRNEESIGMLPPPLLTLTNKNLFIPEKNSYLGNIPILQKAAKKGGFINSTPDADAIIRFSPLVYRFGSEVFGSLALVAVSEYLNAKKINLIAKPYQEMDFLEAIELDQRSIPVDTLGRILVPFRGPAYTFPVLSATDVLHKRVPIDAVRGKLVFIGATATGSGDLVATPMSRSYNGVEIHATIAQSIIDGYLPFKPGWEKGVSVALILLFGIVLSIILPHLGPIPMLFVSGGSIGSLFLLDYWMWSHETMVLSFFVPILVIVVLFLFNTIYGFVAEAKQRQAIKNIFGQYVSSDHIDLILKEGLDIEMKGESKDLTVLFSDIRGFTTLSEKMSATELTSFLNEYFTAMTEVIFQNQGTIDKYIGDAIMAFWGAPIEDSANPYHAVKAALGMQKKLDEFNKQKGSNIHIGAGIGTGNMFVGDMGSKFRRSYTVMGDTVNLGSRLEGLTKHYGVKVIVSENTYLATSDRFLYRKLDKVQVKGKERAVAIFEPICPIEEADPKLQKEIDLHTEALDAYCKGDWDHARKLWTQLNSKFYLERMPPGSQPGPNWDGVQKYETK
ncbi:MAG: adenylate/guanylate cyclase domain-containing protein [Parachlamydiales bacterium]|nr:adenylate/guanylate cyclase domain-containing protein [Parachlamydiales bacterium]